jgi:AcrR family transcriptional regulator
MSTVRVTAKPDRKQAILLAAERLFAQKGYHAVSIRQIADEASVPLALVGYYFGPKQDLFHAIFAHWNSTIEERLAALAQAQTSPLAHRLEHIVEAFIRPVLRLRASSEGEYYALLVARELAHATVEADRVLRDYFDPLAHAFIDALQTVAPPGQPCPGGLVLPICAGCAVAPFKRQPHRASVAWHCAGQ